MNYYQHRLLSVNCLANPYHKDIFVQNIMNRLEHDRVSAGGTTKVTLSTRGYLK